MQRRAERLAHEKGHSTEEVLQAMWMARPYLKLFVPYPGGKVDIEPAIRRMAEDQGIDPDEFVVEVQGVIASM